MWDFFHIFAPVERDKIMSENFIKFYMWTKTFNKKLVEYNKDKLLNGCRPFRESKTNLENGVYLTIRAGLGGIYSMLDEWKDGHWGTRVLDNSYTIAYRPLTSKEEEKYKTLISNLKKEDC